MYWLIAIIDEWMRWDHQSREQARADVGNGQN